MIANLQIANLQAVPDGKSRCDALYRQYREFMFRVAYGILHNKSDAEDAVHNAFLSIVKHIDKITGPEIANIKSCILTITQRKAIDIYREHKKYPGSELPDDAPEHTSPYPGELNLAGCLAALPPRYRQVILLKYGQGYNLHEIAGMLDISWSLASKLDQRAKKKLYGLCKEQGVL